MTRRKKTIIIISVAVPLLGAAFLILVIVGTISSYTSLIDSNSATVSSSTSTTSMPSTVNIPGNVDSLPVSNNLVKFIESWESFSSTGYNGLDYWNTTIGYGHVELPGQDYTSITQPQAEQLLISDLKIYSASVENEFVGYNLTQNQLDALTDLCFGLGTNIWPSISLTHDVKSHASDDVIKSDYEALDNVGGSPSEGLLRRRDAEYIMFTQDVYELNT